MMPPSGRQAGKGASSSRYTALVVALVLSMLLSCVGGAPVSDTVLPSLNNSAAKNMEKDAIERLLVVGGPQDLKKVVDTVDSYATISREKQFVYIWLAYEFAKLVYPEIMTSAASPGDAPQDDPLVRMFMDARNGRPVVLGDKPTILEALLPVLAVFRFKTAAANSAALSAAELFSRFGQDSAIADLARGLALDRMGDLTGAGIAFNRSLIVSPDCYPASIAYAKVLTSQGKAEEALAVLDAIDPVIMKGLSFRRVRAAALYAAGRYQEAEPFIIGVLLDDPMDSKYMLMRAHLLIEKKQYKQGVPLLDAYASVDPNDRLYILLRARVALENTKDRISAIALLRRGLELYPDDSEFSLYAASVLAGGTPGERSEAIILAGKVLAKTPDSLFAMRILLETHIAFGDFAAATRQADAILRISPIVSDYELFLNAYQGGGRQADAKILAEAWLKAEPDSEKAALAYASILVDGADKKLAGDLVTRLLAGKGSASFRSALFLLQSKLQATPELALTALRSALVENGLNIEGLLAMSDYYINTKDYQRARFYLKQAFSLSPDRKDVITRKNSMAQLGILIP